VQQSVDFVITQVWRGTSADVLARCATVGEAAGSVTVASDLRQEIDEDLATLGKPGVSLDLIEALGRTLGDLLFPGDVTKLFQRALKLRGPQDRLRLRLLQFVLSAHENWHPGALPWEFADIREDDGVRPLLDHEGVSLVRHPVAASAARRLVTVERLRALSVLNSRVGGHAQLSDLQPAIGDPQLAPQLSISLQVAREATLDDLVTAARDLGGLDLFEYSGHGVGGGGGLVLHGSNGRMDARVEQRDLAVLQQAQIILLNACDTAAARAGAHSLAEGLVRDGVPVVVAMQFPIKDRVASQFGRGFGRALLEGKSVDRAVADGRAAVRLQNSRDPRTWLAPVVYTRTDDGAIFRPPFSPAEADRAVSVETAPTPVAIQERAPSVEVPPTAPRSTWDAAHEPVAILPGAGARALYDDRQRLLVASLDGTALVMQDATGRVLTRLPTGLDSPGELIVGQDRRLLMAVDGEAVSFLQLDAGAGWPASPFPIGLPDRGVRVLAFRSEGSGLAVVGGDATSTSVLRLNARGRALRPGPQAPVRATSAALLGRGLLLISDDGTRQLESAAAPRLETLLGSLPGKGWHRVDVDSSTPAGETVALLRAVDGGSELFVVDADGVRSAVFGTPPGTLQLVRSFAARSSGLVAVGTEDGVGVWSIEELPAWVSGKGVQR